MNNLLEENNSKFSTNFKDRKIQSADKFRTYKTRLARQSAVQASYLFEFNKNIQKMEYNTLFQPENKIIDSELINKCANDIFMYYKMTLFTYENNQKEQKNSRIDEIFTIRLIQNLNHNIKLIDSIITSKLKDDWTVMRLDSIMRSIIRVALAETIIMPDTEISILTAEYTEVASKFFTGKMIGFANGIIQACIKELKAKK